MIRAFVRLPVEIEFRDPPTTPTYQAMVPEAVRMHRAGLTLKAIAQHFGVDDYLAAKAVRWLRSR